VLDHVGEVSGVEGVAVVHGYDQTGISKVVKIRIPL
jgi:hypothetical protein